MLITLIDHAKMYKMVLVKNLRTSSEQSQACCPTEDKNKASRLEISEIIRTEHQCLKGKIC